jgi:CTP synthase
MPDQKEYLEKHQYGGTIRLGAWKCKVKKGTVLYRAYTHFSSLDFARDKPHTSRPTSHFSSPLLISERHRHRYEFNNQYRKQFEKAGMKISGISPDGKLVEAVEIPNHPFFVGTQFHPEYKSRPLASHPLFVEFIKASC